MPMIIKLKLNPMLTIESNCWLFCLELEQACLLLELNWTVNWLKHIICLQTHIQFVWLSKINSNTIHFQKQSYYLTYITPSVAGAPLDGHRVVVTYPSSVTKYYLIENILQTLFRWSFILLFFFHKSFYDISKNIWHV